MVHNSLVRSLCISAVAAVCATLTQATDFGSEACREGFVWREACGPNDHVCVTPETRTQAAQDNSQAGARRRPGGGDYGPDTCLPGYVWREACGPQDHVCVAPGTRDRTALDSAQASYRFQEPPVLWDVLTQHNDQARSGAQLHETILKPSNVNASSFGRLYERHVDGQIITQPLYVSNQSIPSIGLRNVVYVATRKNLIYAFDADSTDPDPSHGLIWSTAVPIEPANVPPGMCGETRGPMGITSTPVIDRASDTMYVVARNGDGSIWLHALDIATGRSKAGTPGRVRIAASVVNSSGQTISFNQSLELSRAALLLHNGAIYMSFSALNCDNGGWRGWVLAYRAPDLQQVGTFVTVLSAGAQGGGIWQSGNGLVADGAGNVYFETGNGDVLDGSDLGQSFVKLSTGPPPFYGFPGAPLHYTVSNYAAINGGDTDLASGGPVLLPGGILIGGGKQGKLYALHTTNMIPSQNGPTPGPVPPGGSDGFQAAISTWHDDTGEIACTDVGNSPPLGQRCYMPHPRYEESEMSGPNIHGGPIYWDAANPSYGLIYLMAEKDYLRAFRYDHGSHLVTTTASVVGTVRSPDGMPGSFLALSANGSADGIVWASIPKIDGQWQNGPGRIIAFDALTLSELWRDDDDVAFPKFTPPTVAGGKVFRPTFADKLIVYGLRTTPASTPCYSIDGKYQSYTGPNGLLGAPTGPESPATGGGRFRNYANGSIYWTASTCAQVVAQEWRLELVVPAIYTEWQSLNLEQGILGFPTTDETAAPDGIGRYNHFQLGSIYWSPLTGAHEVHGLIRDKWASMGWERSSLGYPVSDETDELDGSGRFSLFEHGSIHWNRTTNTTTVHVYPGVVIGPNHTNFDRPGSDITNMNLPAAIPAMCQQQCADNASCHSWTYVNPGVQGPQARCWLKGSSLPLEQQDACCTSGIRVETNPANMRELAGAVDRPGSDFAAFDMPASPLLCQAECSGNNACQAWAYTGTNGGLGGHCWLKNAKPVPATNLCCVSGMKGEPAGAAIWRYTGTPCSGDSCPGWQRLDNNPKTISIVSSSNQLYQLHNDGMIWVYTGTACSGVFCPGWQRLDNNSKTIAITAGGSQLFQLHNDGWIWRYTGTPCSVDVCPGWQRLDNNSKTIAIVANSSQLFQLHNDGRIWRYTGTPCSGNSCPGWQELDNNSKTIAIVAAGDELYQLHNDGRIWRYTGTPCNGNACPGWQLLDNNSKTVAIAAAGSQLYQLHNDGRIWQYTGTPCNGNACPGWQLLDNNSKTVAIAAAGSQLYQLHNDGWIWQYTDRPCDGNSCPGWRRLDNNPRTGLLAAGDQLYQLHLDPVFQLHNSGWIWRYIGPECDGDFCPGWERLDNNGVTDNIAAAGSQLFQLHNDGRIWRYTGTPCSGNSCPSWQMLDNNSNTKAIAAGGNQLFQLHNDGRIWRYTGAPCSGNSCPSWQMLDNNSNTKAIAAGDNQLFQLHNDGRIWRYTGAPCSGNSCPSWQMLDNNSKTVAITGGGTGLYQLHNDGWIWRYTGTPCDGNSCPGWERLDNNQVTREIVATGDRLYQRHSDGSIWRYTGPPCTGDNCPGWRRLDNNQQTKHIVVAEHSQ